jgi:hypothetical protein
MNRADMSNTKTTIVIAGSPVEVDQEANVRTTLMRILEERGIDSFTILVNGEEVTSTADLPEKFDGNTIEVQRYVKAG